MFTTQLSNEPMSNLSLEIFRGYFIYHLKRINCVKSHLAERLSELEFHDQFVDLSETIQLAEKDLALQALVIDKIFELVGIPVTFDECPELVDFVENAFSEIHLRSAVPALRDLTMFSYLLYIRSIGNTSFQLLRRAATQLPGLNFQELLQLLNERVLAEDKLFFALRARCGLSDDQLALT